MNELAVDAFLEHHGVKGQKWGIRNVKASISSGAHKTGEFIKRHKKGIAVGAGVAAIAAGAAFVAKQNHTKIRMAEFQNINNRIREITNELHFSRNNPTHFTPGLKDQLQHLKEHQLKMTIGKKAWESIAAGPIGSTSVSRLNGAIPLPKTGK